MSMNFGRAVFQSLARGSGPQIHRCFSTSTTVRSGAYDSDGKTTVTILNSEPGLGLMINSYSQRGFRLNNGSFVFGPIALFPKTVLSWNVFGDDDIDEDSLELFTLLEPKPDILVVGFGQPQSKRKLDKLLQKFRLSKGINLEILQTERAVSTFNFLNAEKRYVVAALIPPEFVDISADEAIAARKKKKRLYQEDDP